MAYDKVVDSSVLDAGLTVIADAIRAKSGISDSLDFPTAMADAIAAIEAGGGGGNFFMGEITPSDGIIEIDLASYGVRCDKNNTPRARFLLEKTLEVSDISHTKSRVLFYLGYSTDEEYNAPKNNRDYVVLIDYQTSGSYFRSAKQTSVSSMWRGGNPDGTTAHAFVKGSITDEEAIIRIASPTTPFGLVAGRTYIWGVFY